MSKKILISLGILLLGILPSFLLSDFRLSLLSKYLVFAIVAISVNFLWGHAGILSLGHGVYFALGGYAFAMYLKLQSQPFPDFMEWSGLESLPWFWKPFEHLPFALLMVVLLPVTLSLIVGIPLFLSGVKGVYFTILSQAITLIFGILFVGLQAYTGGTNGLTGFKGMFGHYFSEPIMVKSLYFITLLVLVLIFFQSKYMLGTHGGKIIEAIRDRETRLQFLGYKTDRFKVIAFATSAAWAGIAGALFVPIVGIISPSTMSILFSTEFVIWVAIGGRGTLLGPIVGALVVNYAKTTFSESLPDLWLFMYGFLFIAATLIFPKGIVGFVQDLISKRKNKVKHAA